MGDENDWKGLSATEKIDHKNWKARVEGYEEALKEMQKAGDGKDPLFVPYLNLAKKMVMDSNAAAQEKALEVMEVFVAEANCAPKAAGEVCSGIVNKGLNATRPKTKERSIEILKLYIEAEKQDVVFDELIKGLALKSPKNIVGSAVVLKEAIHEFGPKIFPLKELFKHIPKLLEDRDKGVRESGKDLIIEIYSWIGRTAIEPMLSQLKSVQVTGLTEEFEKISNNEKPSVTRYLRSQKPKVTREETKDETVSATHQTTTAASMELDIDPYDLLDPVEVIKNIPNDFFTKIREQKWTERKEALETIDKLTNHPKLLPGDYDELIQTLLQVVQHDKNVILVSLGAKVIGQIANGLRKKFTHGLSTIKICLEKFKEKKANVVKSIRDCVDSCYITVNLDNCMEDILAALNHKTPSVRSETALFINRIFEKSKSNTLSKKQIKPLATALAKLCLDSVPEVRDACFATLGQAMFVVSEKVLKPFLDGIDNVKMGRIMECYEKVKENSQNTNTGAPNAIVSSKKVTTEQSSSAAIKKPTEKKAQIKKVVKEEVSKKPQAPKLVGGGAKQPVVPVEAPISEDDAIYRINEKLGEKFVELLTDKNYKERLAALEKLQNFVNEMDPKNVPCQLVIKVISIKPGLKDNNIQVMKAKLEMIKNLVMKSKITWTAVEICIPDLTDKIGDVKNSVAVKSTLTEMCDVLDLTMVADLVIKTASENVNIKNIIETLNWISDVIQEFGFKIPMDKILPYIKSTLSHTSPIIRQNSIKLIGVISLYVRDVIGTLLKDEKPSVKQLIDQEIENNRNKNPPPPSRGPKNVLADEEPNDGGNAKAAPSIVPETNPEDFIPRDNISASITEELLEKLADKSWKIKKESFENIERILKGHAGISGDGIHSLLTALAKNVTDSSAVVKRMALESLTAIAQLLSKKDAEKFAKTVLPGLLSGCADAKPKNREEAIAALNIWTEKAGFTIATDGGIVAEAMKVDNPFQRTSILNWMNPYLKEYGENKALKKTLYPDFGAELMSPFFGCLEDRNPEVRKAAQEALLPLMSVLGYEQMMKFHNSSTKLASKENIKQFLDKAKEQLPKPEMKKETVSDKGNVKSETSETIKEVKGKKTSDPKNGKKEDTKKTKGNKKTAAPVEPVAEGPVIALLNKSSNKRQRIMDDKKKRIMQWEPNLQNIQQLESQFNQNCSPELLSLLFHKDFKSHIRAIEMLSNFLTASTDDNIEAIQQNLDIILKWSIIRFNETNPSVTTKCIDFLIKAFTALSSDQKFQLHDQEAMSFLPGLLLKLGDGRDQVRNDTRTLLNTILSCYSENKLVQFLEDQLDNKVARIRQECTDFLRSMIENKKLDPYNQKSLLKAVAQLVSQRDNGVRTAALNCLVAANNIMGEDLTTLLKFMNKKEWDMLTERIKRIGKPQESSEGSEATSKTTLSTSTDKQNIKMDGHGGVSPSRGDVLNTSKPSNPQPGPIDINPILAEDISNRLIDLDKDIAEINQPLEELKLNYTGRLNHGVNSNDAIRAVINDINDSDIGKSIQAMAQIDEVVRNDDVCQQLKPYMDKLINSITMQLKVNLGKLSDEKFNESEVTDMFRAMLATLVSIFNVKELAVEIGRNGLMELIEKLLYIVLNDQLVAMAEGAAIVRGINVLSVRILESSNQTLMLSALMRLMNEALKRGDTGSKYLHLIFKCLWSMTKNLINTINSIDLVVVMKEINSFFTQYPPSKWSNASKDVPMRTVKTMIHSLINNKNGGVLEAIYQIPHGPNNELDAYVRKTYTKLGISIPTKLPTPPTESIGHSKFNDDDLNSIKRGIDTKHSNAYSNKRPYLEELKQIFCKIGQPNESSQGLMDLYNFKVKYPYVDLDRYLSQTSSYFQKTIENGLKEIANSQMAGGDQYRSNNNQSNNNGAASQGPYPSDDWANCNMDPDNLFKRLKKLRQSIGLEQINRPGIVDVLSENKPLTKTSSIPGEMENSFIAELNPSGDGPVKTNVSNTRNLRRMSSDEIASYRNRMAKLKKQS